MMRRLFTSLVLTAAVFCFAPTRAEAQGCPAGAVAGPFCIDGDDADGDHKPTSGVNGQTNVIDPVSAQGTKELSAKNGNDFKLFNIPYGPLPTLDLLSMPDKVDLSHVSTQSAVNTSDGHLWFYFAWTRVTTTGSGFITIELQKNGLNQTLCNYGAVQDFTKANDAGVLALIKSCNPWAGRRDNDLLISWNQVGNSNLTLYVQHWCAVDSARPDCAGIKLPSWGAATQVFAGGQKAAFCDPSGNSFCGEAAIDLTALQGGESCTTFANIIPNTVTGNTLDFQATSDYKDTVFFNFPIISNCGKLTVTKRLVDADGKTLTDTTSTFGYKVDRATLDGSGLNTRVRFDLNVASPSVCTATPTEDHCVDGPAPQRKLERANSFGGVALKAGVTQVHDDLILGSDYRLVETSITPSALYVLVNAVCMDGAPLARGTLSTPGATAAATSINVNATSGIANGDYIRIGTETLLVTSGGGAPGALTLGVERAQLGSVAIAHSVNAVVTGRAVKIVSTTLNTPGANTFQIAVADAQTGYEQTDCVITNQFVKGNTSISTQQRARVNDTAYITRENSLGPNDTSGDVTIKLYNGSVCAGTPIKTKTFAGGQGVNVGLQFNVTTNDTDFTQGENQATASGETTFSWKAAYAGDSKNNPFETGCKEVITININNNVGGN